MKLSKTSWLILTAGILIMAFVSVDTAHSQKIQEQNQLQEELALAEMRLSKFQLEELATQQEELDRQLSQTVSQFEADKAILSQPTTSITASDALLDIAQDCDVKITEVSSSASVNGNLEGVNCSVLPLTVRVEGDISSLISFVIKLNSNFKAGAVKSVEISIPETSSGEEQEEEEKEKSSVNVHLLIYTYKGD